MKLKLITLLLVFSTLLGAKELQKVSLQLQWLDQFQFAGYYMAKEKGFYEKLGLDVEIKKYAYGIIPVDEVINKRATYGVGRSGLIVNKAKGADIQLLSAIFQSSPSIILTTKDSNITHIEDFKGKKIMATPDAIKMVSIYAMTNQHEISQNDLVMLEHTFDVNDLISKKTDLMLAYTSNEPFLLQEKGVEYTIFDPKDHGFDFYSDILFTSSDEINSHKHRAINFKKASLRGWEYAFAHIDETVNLILEKYNAQHKSKEALLYEAKELKKLAYYNTKKLGHIDTHKIQRIYDIYNVMGFAKNTINMQEFIFSNKIGAVNLTQEEKAYLKSKKELRVCIDPDWMPFESFKDGKHIGLSADYLKLFQKNLDLPMRVITTQSWSQALAFSQQRKCDLISLATKTKEREQYLNFTTPLITTPISIATKLDTNFIVDFKSLLGKKIALPKDYASADILQKKYPYLKIIEVKNINEGLKKVREGEIYGLVGSLATLGYMIQKDFMGELKIGGKFDENLEVPLAVRNDHKPLIGIFQKLIDNISEEEHQYILNRWISLRIEKKVDYTLLWQLLGGFLFILAVGMLFLIKQNRLKRALEQKNRELDTYFSSMNDGFAIADVVSKKIILCNRAFEKLTGYSQEELKLLTIDSLHPKESLSYVMEQFIKQAEGEIEIALSIPILHKNQTSITMCDISTNSYVNDEGNILNIGIFRDITSKLKLEDELLELNKNLEQTVEDEVFKNREKDKQMLSQSRLAQMGEMISMIAHQWRQPLGAISTTAVNLKLKIELEAFNLKTQEGITESNEYFLDRLENIENYVHTLTTTIDDFRNFYKPNKESVNVNFETVATKALDIIKASLLNDNIELTYEYNSQEAIEIYDSEMMQVILNILKNAQDNFGEKGIENPKITISTFAKSISICDNGGGIPQDVINKIFDPYFSTKHEKNGTGLGLYMSKTIVEDHHNGNLHVNNQDGGVCFTIELSKGVNTDDN